MNYLDEAVTKSLDEFMEYYKVVDTEEIYSNGTEFVPIFRVKQWEEYNNKDKEIERLTKRLEEAQLGYLAVEEKNKRLHSIIKEVREYIKSYINQFNGVYPPVDMRYLDLNKILEILDKKENI